MEPRGLAQFVGKTVLVQLQGGEPWMGVCSEEGEPAPIMVRRPNAPEPALMHAPFFQGKLLEYELPWLVIEFLDQNRSRLLQALHQDTIAGVTMVVEQAAVHIIQPE
jgi:hypothetical protein